MLESTELMRAVNLTINNASGDIYAAGPGVVTTVRFGSGGMDALGNMPGQSREVPVAPRVGNPNHNPAASTNGNTDKKGLTYLNVTFQHHIEGNIVRRQIEFHDQVKAVYGPVKTWEERLPDDDPDGVGPEGAILSCRKLTVTSMETPITKENSIELEATGNALIEGMLFTARGARVSFNQAKDLMILEGDGRNPASLYYQEIIGGLDRNLHAQRIKYWPETGKTSINDAQSMDFFIDTKAAERKRQ
jgi:hypothetical protein